MPTYQYRCSKCGNELEIVQKISDASLTTCPQCKEESFERVISGEGGFVLKGSGFYKTDYNKSAAAPSSCSTGSTGSCSTGTCPFAS